MSSGWAGVGELVVVGSVNCLVDAGVPHTSCLGTVAAAAVLLLLLLLLLRACKQPSSTAVANSALPIHPSNPQGPGAAAAAVRLEAGGPGPRVPAARQPRVHLLFLGVWLPPGGAPDGWAAGSGRVFEPEFQHAVVAHSS